MALYEQNSETAFQELNSTPLPSSRSQQANRAPSSSAEVPAAPLSAQSGADEAIPAANTTLQPSRRQKPRARKGAEDQPKVAPLPELRAAGPTNFDGHYSDAPQNAHAVEFFPPVKGTILPNPPAYRGSNVLVRVGEAGQAIGVPASFRGLPAPTDSDDHSKGGDHSQSVIGSNDGDQCSSVTHGTASPVVAEIIQLWRMRQRWHRAEKSLILQGRALCRAWTAGDKDKANDLFDAAAKGQDVDPFVAMALAPFLKAIDNFAPERAAIEKRLRKLAKSLPVYPWVAECKGFGDLNLAAIVGEAGDIGSYRNPSCLWKRMGLAVIGDGRQRRVSGDAALEHGYSPDRRCVAYLLGETLIKAGDKCPYRPLYNERKAYEAERVESKAHAHNRAARYITKRALRDLWSAWRAADQGQTGNDHRNDVAPVGTNHDAEII